MRTRLIFGALAIATAALSVLHAQAPAKYTPP